jgi:hypothetical protein
VIGSPTLTIRAEETIHVSFDRFTGDWDKRRTVVRDGCKVDYIWIAASRVSGRRSFNDVVEGQAYGLASDQGFHDEHGRPVGCSQTRQMLDTRLVGALVRLERLA